MENKLRSYKVLHVLTEHKTTVKPVLSGPVLNGHPLLSGQLQKCQKFLLLTTLNVTSIKRSPLHVLSGRGRSHVLSGHFKKRKPYERALNVVILVTKSSYFF